jgi:uncharacterized DUF497 family protein
MPKEPLAEPKVVWDPRKAVRNLNKHNVTFDEAATVFRDWLAITKQDPDHSISERRFVTLGLSSNQRLVLVAHTDDSEEIRIISARLPTRSERNAYEND